MFLSKVKVKKFAKLEEKFGDPKIVDDRHYKQITTEENTNPNEIYHVIQYGYLDEGYFYFDHSIKYLKEKFLVVNEQKVLIVAKDMYEVNFVLESDIEMVTEG